MSLGHSLSIQLSQHSVEQWLVLNSPSSYRSPFHFSNSSDRPNNSDSIAVVVVILGSMINNFREYCAGGQRTNEWQLILPSVVTANVMLCHLFGP